MTTKGEPPLERAASDGQSPERATQENESDLFLFSPMDATFNDNGSVELVGTPESQIVTINYDANEVVDPPENSDELVDQVQSLENLFETSMSELSAAEQADLERTASLLGDDGSMSEELSLLQESESLLHDELRSLDSSYERHRRRKISPPSPPLPQEVTHDSSMILNDLSLSSSSTASNPEQRSSPPSPSTPTKASTPTAVTAISPPVVSLTDTTYQSPEALKQMARDTTPIPKEEPSSPDDHVWDSARPQQQDEPQTTSFISKTPTRNNRTFSITEQPAVRTEPLSTINNQSENATHSQVSVTATQDVQPTPNPQRTRKSKRVRHNSELASQHKAPIVPNRATSLSSLRSSISTTRKDSIVLNPISNGARLSEVFDNLDVSSDESKHDELLQSTPVVTDGNVNEVLDILLSDESPPAVDISSSNEGSNQQTSLRTYSYGEDRLLQSIPRRTSGLTQGILVQENDRFSNGPSVIEEGYEGSVGTSNSEGVQSQSTEGNSKSSHSSMSSQQLVSTRFESTICSPTNVKERSTTETVPLLLAPTAFTREAPGTHLTPASKSHSSKQMGIPVGAFMDVPGYDDNWSASQENERIPEAARHFKWDPLFYHVASVEDEALIKNDNPVGIPVGAFLDDPSYNSKKNMPINWDPRYFYSKDIENDPDNSKDPEANSISTLGRSEKRQERQFWYLVACCGCIFCVLLASIVGGLLGALVVRNNRSSVLVIISPNPTVSLSPSQAPSSAPSLTASPSHVPSSSPSRAAPSASPSTSPSQLPSSSPSKTPSARPSTNPSAQPSTKPSTQPSVEPSTQPSTQPSTLPSTRPSTQPSTRPSLQPSETPSRSPSKSPSQQPSTSPSQQPSASPSQRPSKSPSSSPSSLPTQSPSRRSTGLPSFSPSLSLDLLLPESPLLDLLTERSSDDGVAIRTFNSPQQAAYIFVINNYGILGLPLNKQVQKYALTTLYYSTSGSTSWFQSENWLSTTDDCDWQFTLCNENDILVGLNVNWNNLVGSLPPEIGLLSKMDSMIIRSDPTGGSLTGSLPSELGLLTDLRRLIIQGNRLSGTIPTELGQLSVAKQVNLSDNNLLGTIPEDLGNLRDVTQLNLSNNNLVGTLPRSLGTLAELAQLDMSNNALSGTIFSEVSDLASSLESFSIAVNMLSGTVPTELGLLTSIRSGLFLQDNFLEGRLPTELGNLVLIQDFRVDGNLLTGTIPDEFAQWNAVSEFRINFNDFSGILPSDLCEQFTESGTASYADCSEIACLCCENCF